MLLEYFQMVDTIVSADIAAGTVVARSTVPDKSTVFEGHFPGMPLVPGVLLIETMAQTSGMLLLGLNGLTAMPFLMMVDSAKMRTFVGPGAVLEIEAKLEHEGSGFAVTKAKIRSEGKAIADAQLKFRTLSFEDNELAPLVRKRAEEVGLLAAIGGAGAGEGS
ncbi:3-hydroxyacyl-ACP dehydratase FabZ family protein [Martelella endophytica]|uniref:3-hydroxyacyl-ACP dehydratase n=1 Tax=Martelella endophytica TaxID=1486262 RepID=A0A0D5LS53_MAREN|nr:3-hydroxyacyl-ACP dehydratase FabZ family protein [Martelella endophytica]AJY47019.1 3-hydroxyacyl-ACP dehydratase [Martelella endophytica]